MLGWVAGEVMEEQKATNWEFVGVGAELELRS